jgi:prevent-host-death family protein
MTISVSELKARCLEIIREVERDRKVVDVVRRGEVVARILPGTVDAATGARPWERLRGSGVLLGKPEESVLEESDFEASR